ncbi:relaxase/mobilization nuclease domain-containing protein [Ellagibacter isourolithinifaciens]|uniref:relaxase/mobilization nuclease domain-containing protein n=1 Tax=Ellagibacter isourolithinifaciens TaxID=2137581 RepID=UPI003A91084E
MPILKPISGHTGCRNVRKYLEKNGRAIARDFFNLSWDEREMSGYDQAGKEAVEWDREMDRMRASFGNDAPCKGRKARTYKHFVISPDPEDDIDIEALRGIASDWALRFFGDHQIAIVYHDDNANGIPHAHVVVNNTNLKTGNRMQTPNPLELNRTLQDMARARGLRGLSNEAETKSGVERLAAKERDRETPAKSQDVHMSRAEHEIVAEGGYSWVADIRSRVSIAKGLSRNGDEFRQVLDLLGVEVAPASARNGRDDWVYSIKGVPKCKVSGGKLGYAYSKQAIERSFGGTSLAGMSNREVLKAARSAIELDNLGDLQNLASALETCSKYGIASRADAITRARAMEAKAERSFGAPRAVAAATEIREAAGVLSTYGLLPEKTTGNARPDGGKHRAEAHAQNSRQKEQEAVRKRQRAQHCDDRGER